ncbi:MAG: SusF/SusE family outer membrane protein [Prevotella sp.]|nr:SusF/SusE family outer membrane protein [Prevotella sp.]
MVKVTTLFRLSTAFIICHLSFSDVAAQDALWATGSAIPDDEAVQLTRRPDGKFTYTGPMDAGELKIMTTAEPNDETQYLTPQMVDSYLINYGLTYVLTSDASREGWVVSFQEDTYRFVVDTGKRTVTGELLLPWNEMLIAGSAFEGGANDKEWNRDNMLPFKRDHDNPYVFIWEGYLGHFDVIEPDRFKLEGQMTWGPRELHPYTQDEDILTSTTFRTGGDDTKWHVYKEGRYRIRVDLFNETIQATLL